MADYTSGIAVQPNMVKKTTLVDQSGNKSTGYYDTAKQAYAEMLENARKQNATAADAQIGKLGADAQQAGAGLWNSYQQQMRRTPQQLAAMGISGGAAESTVVGAGNNYLQQMAELDRQRRQQEADIRLNQSTNDNSAYQQYINNMLALDQSNRDFNLREQAAELEKQQIGMQDAMSYADLTGDYSLLIQYGYTPEQIAQLQKAWQVDNAKKYAAMTGQNGGYRPTVPEPAGNIVSLVIDASHNYSETEIKGELDSMLADGTLSEADYRKGINALGTMQRRLTN